LKHFENAANIAIVVGVLVFLGVVARNEFGKPKQADMSAKALIGQTVAIPGIHFSTQQSSLVLAISSTCHFCKESLPFYRDLVTKTEGKVRIVAVLPEPQAEAEAYLQQAAMASVKVVSAQLDSIGVHATPTLLLLDDHGKIQNAWIGKLDGKGQQEVLTSVGHNNSIE